MFKSLIVVDDVYDDPEKILQAGQRLSYPPPLAGANYAGRNSSEKLLLADSDKMLSWVAGESLIGASDRAHGALRLTLAGDVGRYCVHVDVGVDWSGVLYLNRSEYCSGGTHFFRHRATGMDHAPVTGADLARCNAKTPREALDRILGQDSNDETQWEPLLTVPMRFNRLVLFRPLLWHSAGDGFGTSIEDGRLVQLFFLRGARKDGAPDRSEPVNG